jgi:hypothetical protein
LVQIRPPQPNEAKANALLHIEKYPLRWVFFWPLD